MYYDKLSINMELLINGLLYDGFERVDYTLLNLVLQSLIKKYRDHEDIEFFERNLSKKFYENVDYNPMGIFTLKKKDKLLDSSLIMKRMRICINSLDLYEIVSKKKSILGDSSMQSSKFLYSSKEINIYNSGRKEAKLRMKKLVKKIKTM